MKKIIFELREIRGNIIEKIVAEAEGLSPATRKIYTFWLSYFRSWTVKRYRWTALSPDEQQTRFNSLIQGADLFDLIHAFKKHLTEAYAGKSAALALDTLNAFWVRMVAKNYVARNPFVDKDLRAGGLKNQQTKNRTISDSEYSRLKKEVMAAGDRLAPAIFLVLGSSGLRVGELLDLRRENVNGDGKWIRVERGKGGKARWTRINSEARTALDAHLSGRGNAGDKVFDLTPLRAWRLMKKYARKAKINKDFTNHSLRNRFVFTSRRAGLSREACSWLVGHSTKGMNDKYREDNLEEFKKLVGLEYDEIQSALT